MERGGDGRSGDDPQGQRRGAKGSLSAGGLTWEIERGGERGGCGEKQRHRRHRETQREAQTETNGDRETKRKTERD